MLKKRKPRRIHHDPIVRRVAALLDTGRPTRFRYEAVCRAGIREARCLAGDAWNEADKFARLIVTLALHRLGISRPTWQQARADDIDGRRTTVQRRRCAGCGGELDDTERRMWCSTECGRVTRQRERNRMIAIDKAMARAALVALKRQVTRDCGECGKPFVVMRQNALQKFCSNACRLDSERVNETRQCRACGTEFKAGSKNGQHYCSMNCYTGAKGRREERYCLHCGSGFSVKPSRPNRFCSISCSRRYRPPLVCEAA